MAYPFPQSDVLSDASRMLQAIRSAPSGLGALEALAFRLGMRDGPQTLRTSMLARWLENLFAIKPRPALTDPRLEGIRRVTVALRHGPQRQADIEIERALGKGVGEQSIAAIRARLRPEAAVDARGDARGP